MGGTFEDYLRLALAVMAILMKPFAWLESLCLARLGVDDATTFRMLPLQDADPEFPAILPNGLALIHILMIPYLVSMEEEPGSGMTVARLLRPLTSRCSRRVKWLLMLPRIWLYMALFNYHMVSILHDPNRLWVTSLKLVAGGWLL